MKAINRLKDALLVLVCTIIAGLLAFTFVYNGGCLAEQYSNQARQVKE